MDVVNWFQFPTHADGRGTLTVIEGWRSIPFAVKRVFYVYNVPGDRERGGHAHRLCQQVLIAISGALAVEAHGKSYQLSDPGRGLYVPPGVHLDLRGWQPGTVLLVLCSHYYDEEDYVND